MKHYCFIKQYPFKNRAKLWSFCFA